MVLYSLEIYPEPTWMTEKHRNLRKTFQPLKNSPQISGKVVNFSKTNNLNNIILETNFNNPSRYDDLAGDVRDEPDPPTGQWDGCQA